MKKYIYLASIFAFMMSATTSCSDESGIKPEKPNVTNPANIKITTDQSELSGRLVFANHAPAGTNTRAYSGTPAPAIPDDALKLAEQPTNWNNGVTLTRGKAYYIDSAWEEFVSSGSVLDYLAYRSQVDMENSLLPHNDTGITNGQNSRGMNNEDKCKWNNSARNRFK